jgi:hypothetical protein
MCSIVKYLQGGVTLEEIMDMDIQDYALLKHAVEFLGKKEKEEIDKLKSKVK